MDSEPSPSDIAQLPGGMEWKPHGDCAHTEIFSRSSPALESYYQNQANVLEHSQRVLERVRRVLMYRTAVEARLDRRSSPTHECYYLNEENELEHAQRVLEHEQKVLMYRTAGEARLDHSVEACAGSPTAGGSKYNILNRAEVKALKHNQYRIRKREHVRNHNRKYRILNGE